MNKLNLILLMLPILLFAKPPIIDGNTFSIVSKDSVYTPTSKTKHNYRYRAVFYNDYHNEVSGGLYIEKIQRPGAAGSPYLEVWKHQVRVDKIKNLNKLYKKLSFESKIGCCNFINLKWADDYKLHFDTRIGKDNFKCVSSDVRATQEVSVVCKKI